MIAATSSSSPVGGSVASVVAGTVGAAVLGGCYFIFSFCVMDALNAQGPANAIANICADLPPSTRP